MPDCPYAEMDWCCCKQEGHDGPHESAPLGPPILPVRTHVREQRSKLGDCPACGPHTHGSGRPNGVDCRCGRHFHFGDDLWVRTDRCIVCPSCERALSPLDFDHEGNERVAPLSEDRP